MRRRERTAANKGRIDILRRAALAVLLISAVFTLKPATSSKTLGSQSLRHSAAVSATGLTGYDLFGSTGNVYSFGSLNLGGMGSTPLNRPIVGGATTPSGLGYWEVASDGGIFSFGDAQFYGSTGAMTLNKPIVGMASTPDGKGYWLVA
ncbi:MAG: hypothetical protein ACP5O0_10575, partial [Acidimicrobiales bacterium]